MNLAVKELADAYRNAVNAKSCELRGCDAMQLKEYSEIIHEAGIAAIATLVAPLLKDQERLNEIIKISATWKSRGEIDRRLKENRE